MDENALSHTILGAAVEVHKELGPGLLESVYEEALIVELFGRGIAVARQKEVPLTYKGRALQSNLRLDLVVENLVIVEVKAIERLTGIHEAQLLTYLRLAHKKLGLLINFNATTLKNSIRRVVNNL
jgi:GxxExxY protein